ncbi:MAG TPA: DinB family protein [Burkholderiales bacterium]|nr:DinB family protein [Burkholderiales bacterium]
MRAKEFLSRKKIDFVAVDVLNDASGRAALLKLGVRNVPVVAKGDRYVFGQNLEDVAEFVGLQGTGHKPLPPAQLIVKWVEVLRVAQSHVRQVPDARLAERVIDNRDRSIRLMGHHVFRIGEAFLETVVDGVEYAVQLANIPPADGTFTTSEDIAQYGEAVISRLQRWWESLDDKSCTVQIKTFFGMQPVHMLLERSTWHSAQHARQLAAVLERYGIPPRARLTPELLAGLPLPERLWE